VFVNIRDLKYFIAVSETMHFGKAAERCFVSQPTLSGQIKKLEEELGVSLFERTNRSVAITPVGELVLQHAKLVLEQSDAILQLTRAHSDPLAGPLRVGAIPTISPYLMPLILMPLKEKYPQLKLVLQEETTDNLLEHLRAHQVDVVILGTPPDDSDLEERQLFDEPFWLAHHAGHELYTKDDISRKDLGQLDLLLLADGHCLARQVMDVCRVDENKLGDVSADLRAASLETLLQLVSAGYGSTLVPALAMQGAWMTGSGIIVRKLEIKDAFRTVRLVYRKSFPRQEAINILTGVIKSNLPNTVKRK
jgi:LysR family hydrogen peroxide-inducible transcriptional activator